MRKQFTLHLAVLCSLLFSWQAANATHFYVSTLSGSDPGSLTWAMTSANADNSATMANPHVIDICVGGDAYLWPLPQTFCIINGPKDMSLRISGIYYNIGVNLSGIRVSFNNLLFTNNGNSAFGSSFMSSCGAHSTLNNCVFINNNAQYQAGGVFANGDTVIINGCSFKNNYTTDAGGEGGGAAFNNGGYMRITNSTFSNNTSASTSATGAGGAVKNHAGGQMDVINCTFYNNHAQSRGGALQNAPNATCRISNCIFVGNTAAGAGQDLWGDFQSLDGHNLFGDTAGAVISGVVAGNVYGASALNVLDTTLRDNGHYMLTHALITGSPAIDAAEASVAALFDQREYLRNGTPDMGAFEYNGTNTCTGFSLAIDNVVPACAPVLHELGLTITGGTGPYTSNIYDNDVTWLCADSIIHTGSGTFIATVFDAAHCVAKDTIVINDAPPAINYNLSFCTGDSVTFRGNVYSEEGTYPITYDCDSVVIITVTEIEPPYVYHDVQKCAGDSVTINGMTYISYGTYYQYYGCDSIVEVYFHELEPDYHSYEYSICGGDSVTVNGTTYYLAGYYYQYYGCDSTVEVYIDYGSEEVIENFMTLCYGESITVGAHIYTISGRYHDFFACDSVVITNLTVLPQLTLPDLSFDGILCHNDAGTIQLSNPTTLDITIADTTFTFGPDTTWADLVIDFSTQYSPTSWSAQQLLGEPNTYPNYGDINTAWTADDYGDDRDFLVVGYTTPVLASEVLIYETSAPGHIDTVYVRDAATANWSVVYTAAAVAAPEVATIFKVQLPSVMNIDAVRWAIATDIANDWVEYDAVGLVRYSTDTALYAISAGGVYPVTLSAYGCSVADTINVPNPLVSLVVTAADDTICEGQGTVVTAAGNVSYVWSNSVTTASQTVTPAVSTTYSVTATNALGCVATDSVAVVVEICNGINDITADDFSIQVYPNPATDYLMLVCDEQIEALEVYSVIGEQVIFIKGQITKLNIAALAQGAYTVKVKTTQGKSAVKRFIKQ
ncbi:MAG TPA: choice-of-anchor Q domain-containing protein [Chitinophagales bacterium]|nr:choice-of-anchor Q domain-containing protein [Chitinophagales bacterium]